MSNVSDLAGAQTLISGSGISGADCAGYFVNHRGNQLVFVQRPGEARAVLRHSDLAWRPERISPDALRAGAEDARASSVPGRVPTIGDVILNQAEALWPAACFEASGSLRDG